MSANQYTFLDDKEKEAYLAHLDGKNNLLQASEAIGICIDRVKFHRKHDVEFDKKVKTYSKEFNKIKSQHLNPKRLMLAGHQLTPEKMALVKYWVERGSSEKQACVKAGCPISVHNAQKVRDNEYNLTISQAKSFGKTLITNDLEIKLLKLLAQNWEEVQIEYRALLNKGGRPILDKDGNSRLFINKITHKTLPVQQTQALISVISKLIPDYTQKIEVASNINVTQMKPNDIKTIILDRLKSLDQKNGESHLELIAEVKESEFVVRQEGN